MAQLNEPFDPSTVKVDDQFEPLPAGWYSARITDADLRDTRAGTGQYIAVRYDITGPTHEGRVVWQNLNISNPNATAERIGREQLATLVTAIGVSDLVTDTDQLIGGEASIKLTIRKSEEYGDQNEVKGCKGLVNNPAPPAAATAAASTSDTGSKAPWQK